LGIPNIFKATKKIWLLYLTLFMSESILTCQLTLPEVLLSWKSSLLVKLLYLSQCMFEGIPTCELVYLRLFMCAKKILANFICDLGLPVTFSRMYLYLLVN
jgi:hypothetical protein